MGANDPCGYVVKGAHGTGTRDCGAADQQLPVFKDFTNLGRIIKTEYILCYITDKDLRRTVQLQLPLNKGEYRHNLLRWIFFANQGGIHHR